MGTRLRVVVHGAAEAAEAALDEADRWDALLSNFDRESALSSVNRAAGHPVAVPADLGRFLQRAVAIAERTAGLFDPTVGPLVEAYRAGATAADLETARALISWRDIVIRSAEEVGLARPGMRLDPGAIGKGWAVDALVEKLRASGVRAAFIDFGESSFYGLGAPPGEDGWRVLLRTAGDAPQGPVVTLRDQSLSTSMTQVWDEARRARRGHIVDPRDGRLVSTPRLVAVVSPSATDADALATALAVAGRDGLGVLAQFPDAAAWLDDLESGSTSLGSFPAQAR